MATLMDCHRQWATRPADERYTSLTSMHEAAIASRNAAKEFTLETNKLRIVADADERLLLLPSKKKGAEPIGDLTNWSFNQLARVSDATPTAMYKRPAKMVAEWMQYGLEHNQEEVKLLTRTPHTEEGAASGLPELAAITGKDYGRIWDCDVIAKLRQICGDGVSGIWKVPGEFGRPVPITKDNTTLYMGDRDLFVFLANETDKVEVKKRRNGQAAALSRGFFLWQSEVGGSTIGYKTFYYDYVCSNRYVWGAEGVKTKAIRHTKTAPERFLETMIPQMYMQCLNAPADELGKVERTIAAAQAKQLDDPNKFVSLNFGPSMVDKFNLLCIQKEEHVIDTVWDVVTTATEYAQTIPHQDKRVEFEEKATRLLQLAA